MENNNGSGNPPNADNQDLALLDPDALRKEVVTLRVENTKLKGNNRQLFERAKSAEGFEKNEEGEWVKIVSKNEPPASKKQPKSSEELDLGEKAYLRASGIDPSEFALVQKEREESGIQDVEKLLTSGYFQAKLKETRDSKVVANAQPTGTRTGGEDPKTQVDFWLTKGPDDMPPNTYENQQLRQDIVNARIAKAKSQFSSPTP